jgi:hypothetical protein
VDRREVDDVEAHRRDPVELLGRRRERAVHRLPGLVDPAGAAREELVPGAVRGLLAVAPDLVRLALGDQLTHRVLEHDLLDVVREGGCHTFAERPVLVAQSRRGRHEQCSLLPAIRAACHPIE